MAGSSLVKSTKSVKSPRRKQTGTSKKKRKTGGSQSRIRANTNRDLAHETGRPSVKERGERPDARPSTKREKQVKRSKLTSPAPATGTPSPSTPVQPSPAATPEIHTPQPAAADDKYENFTPLAMRKAEPPKTDQMQEQPSPCIPSPNNEAYSAVVVRAKSSTSDPERPRSPANDD